MALKNHELADSSDIHFAHADRSVRGKGELQRGKRAEVFPYSSDTASPATKGGLSTRNKDRRALIPYQKGGRELIPHPDFFSGDPIY